MEGTNRGAPQLETTNAHNTTHAHTAVVAPSTPGEYTIPASRAGGSRSRSAHAALEHCADHHGHKCVGNATHAHMRR